MTLPRLRIVQLITPKRFSGAERVCALMCEELQGRGHDVLVVTKPLPTFEAELAARGIACEPARVGNKFDFSRPLFIRNLLRRFQADLVHTHLSTASQWGMIGAHFAGVPCVAHVHATNRAIWYIWATRVVAVAGAVRDHLTGQGLPADRISVVHNAVETDNLPEVDTAAVRRGLGIPVGAPLVCAAAHLSRKKGLHILLQALPRLKARFPDVRCVLMGDGPARAELAALAERLELGETASFLGFRPDAGDIMAAADVVCLPSIAGEGLPLSLLEASARGRPVVATRLAGVTEAVQDGRTGYVVTPGRVEELEGRLGALLADADARQCMGEAGRAFVAAEFGRSLRCDRIEEVYRLALEAKRSGR